MLDKATKEIKKRNHDLHEMIPKKGGILDPKNVWDKKPSARIIGEGGEIMSNDYLKRFKEIIKK